jgi:shikimate kinase
LDKPDNLGETLSGKSETIAQPMNILLVGPRGAGKTTLGQLLASSLARPFQDLDDLTLRTLNHSSVTKVWQLLGESAWRAAEIQAFSEAISHNNRVIALGGGAPMTITIAEQIHIERHNRRAMVVYLECNTIELSKRLSAAAHDRPSLTGADPADEVREVLSMRENTYRSLADLTVRTDESSAQETAALLERFLRDFEMRNR